MSYQLYKYKMANYTEYFLHDHNNQWWIWDKWYRGDFRKEVMQGRKKVIGWRWMRELPELSIQPITDLQFLVETGHQVKGNAHSPVGPFDIEL